MYDPQNPVWHTLDLGPLPVEALAKLGIQSEPGVVRFHSHAMKHTFEAVPSRRPICWPLLGDVVNNPTHIGQQPKYVGTAFDLVHAVQNGPIILVSILLKPTTRDPHKYAVTSAYPLDLGSLERRIKKGLTIKL